MAEYIEREALIRVICAEFCHVAPAPEKPCDGCHMVEEIADFPAADVVEVKRGRWKGEGMGDYSCSLCTKVVSGNTYNFCPNCGADMREVQEDG